MNHYQFPGIKINRCLATPITTIPGCSSRRATIRWGIGLDFRSAEPSRNLFSFFEREKCAVRDGYQARRGEIAKETKRRFALFESCQIRMPQAKGSACVSLGTWEGELKARRLLHLISAVFLLMGGFTLVHSCPQSALGLTFKTKERERKSFQYNTRDPKPGCLERESFKSTLRTHFFALLASPQWY